MIRSQKGKCGSQSGDRCLHPTGGTSAPGGPVSGKGSDNKAGHRLQTGGNEKLQTSGAQGQKVVLLLCGKDTAAACTQVVRELNKNISAHVRTRWDIFLICKPLWTF